MKQTLLTFALMLLPMLASAAVEKNGIYYNLDNVINSGSNEEHESFIAETIEGIQMSFVVVSEEDKTCEVGVGGGGKVRERRGKGEGGVIPSGVEGPLTIPGEVNGYKVIGIAPYAFMGVEDLSGITALNMPDCLE